MAEPCVFGLDGWEVLHSEIEGVIEQATDDSYPDRSGELEVLEWSTHPPQHHLPSARDIVEHIIEVAAESGEVADGWYEDADRAVTNPAALAAAEALRDAIAACVTFRMADKVVARHRVTWRVADEDIEWAVESVAGASEETNRG